MKELSRRDALAGMAMMGIMGNQKAIEHIANNKQYDVTVSTAIALAALKHADALITELDRTQPQS